MADSEVCHYLNLAAVDRQGGAEHVDVGCGGGAQSLCQSRSGRGVRAGVTEDMRV